MTYWSKRVLDRCEQEYKWHRTLNVLTSLFYCVFALLYLFRAFRRHSQLLVRKDIFLLVAGGSALLFWVGVFSALYHGQPYLVWERADLGCILLFFLFLELYLSVRIFSVAERPKTRSTSAHKNGSASTFSRHLNKSIFLGCATLLFIAIGLTVLTLAFGFEESFAAMVAIHVFYLLALIMLLAWLSLPHQTNSPWRKKGWLLFLAGSLFLMGSVLWAVEEDRCSLSSTKTSAAAALGHLFWHLFSSASVFTLLVFLLEIRS